MIKITTYNGELIAKTVTEHGADVIVSQNTNWCIDRMDCLPTIKGVEFTSAKTDYKNQLDFECSIDGHKIEGIVLGDELVVSYIKNVWTRVTLKRTKPFKLPAGQVMFDLIREIRTLLIEEEHPTISQKEYKALTKELREIQQKAQSITDKLKQYTK